jgi:nanoRNase/pAp phosphatase (c-di-AMP/oligoRNAs hydrolase)
MGRILLLVVLGLGSVFGFAAGARQWRMHEEMGCGSPWAARENRHLDALADACVRAAERVRTAPSAAPATSGPGP